MICGMAERLKLLREDCGLTQMQVGMRIGVAATTISSYERGACAPKVEMLMKLAAIYSTSTDFIIGTTQEHPINISSLSPTQKESVTSLIQQIIFFLCN